MSPPGTAARLAGLPDTAEGIARVRRETMGES